MNRVIVVSGAALAATVGSLMFPAGKWNPAFLVGESTAAPTKTAGSGEKVLTGDAIETHYGTVQVQITLKGTKITDVTVLQSPTGPNQRYSDFAVPELIDQTMKAQSAQIAGASGASYTSAGFIQSLQSALAQK